MTERTAAVYTYLAFETVAPQVEVGIFFRAIDCLTFFSVIFKRVGPTSTWYRSNGRVLLYLSLV